jgi:hypothetical protein
MTELLEQLILKQLVAEAVDTDREFLDKMLERLEKQYGAYLY